MTDIVEVRGVRIGEGIPKIIVPIVEVTRKEIIRKAESLAEVRKDIVEWRADWFEEGSDPAAVEEVLRELRGALGNTPLLFTFRTLREGGEKAIEPEDYAALNISAAKSGFADLIDVEIFTGDEIVREIIESAHKEGVKIVGSSHDFDHAADGSGYSQDRCDAAEQKGCADPSSGDGRDDGRIRGSPDHHDVHVGHRTHQPTVRRGVWKFLYFRRGWEGLCAGPDEC